MVTNALSIDLEYWYLAEYVVDSLPPQFAPEDQITESVTPILDLLDKYDTKVTFFVVGKVAEKYPQLIRVIAQRGHEVALHGYSHERLASLGESRFGEEMEKSIRLVESITGERPIGFRAPSFSIDNDTRWAFNILKKYGIKYDSSIFPVRTPLYGVPGAPLFPYRPAANDVTKADPIGPVVEFPVAVFRCGVKIPVAGGFYLRALPLWFTKLAIRLMNRTGPAVLYLHPWDIYRGTPRVKHMPLFQRFVTYYGANSAQRKLENLLRSFRFRPVGELYRSLEARGALVGEPKVSVVIPVLNMADKIENCLRAVFSQTIKPGEVIIVDGHSTDGTLERAMKFPVTVVHQDYGWAAAARQLGVERAQGEYIAFTDADCIPPPNWLEGLLKELGDGIVGVGGGIKNIGEGLWIQSINIALGTFLGSGNSAQGRLFSKKRFERSINAFNCVYRRKDLVSVGGFNIHLSGADEAELGLRMQRKGKLLSTPEVIVVHDHRRGLAKFARQMFNYGRWRRECRVWALPVVPSLLVLPLLLSLIFTPWVFAGVMSLYLLSVMASGLFFAVKDGEARYLFSIPTVYIVEHVCYIAGYWRELVFPRRRQR